MDGYLGLWRNYNTVLMRDSIFFSVYLATQETLCRRICLRTGKGSRAELSNIEMFFCGGFAGAAAWSAASPADLINSRRQVRYTGIHDKAEGGGAVKASGQVRRTSILEEIRIIFREEGPRAFWKGYSLQVARGFVGYGAFAIGYSAVVDTLKS